MSAFKKLVELINSKKVKSIITRKEIMNSLYGSSSTVGPTTADSYRRQLEVLGYLKGDGCGNYTILKKVEKTATSSSVRARYDNTKIDTKIR